jgi:transposase InsO family protein
MMMADGAMRARPIVPGDIAFVPDVDMPIIQAGQARRDHLKALNDIGFKTERDARQHLRRLERDPEYRHAHDRAAKAYERALATGRARKFVIDQLHGVLRFDASVQPALDAAGAGRLSPLLSPHIIIDRLQVRRREARLERVLRAQEDVETRFAALGVDPETQIVTEVGEDELADAILSRPGVPMSRLGGASFRFINVLDSLQRVNSNVAMSVYLDSEAGRRTLVQRFLEEVRTRRLLRGLGRQSDSRVDEEIEDLLQQLGFPQSFDADQQYERLYLLRESNPEFLNVLLDDLAASTDLLLSETGERTVRGAIAQLNQSERARQGPVTVERRIVQGGLPSLGRR